MPDEQELLRVAMNVVDVNPLGVLTTIDTQGFPHPRWMTAISTDNLRSLITLTADATRKVKHLHTHPKVAWLFQEESHSDIVLIKGNARIEHGIAASHHLWDRMAELARHYAVGPLSDDDHLQLVSLHTDIESIELLSPRLGLLTPQALSPAQKP